MTLREDETHGLESGKADTELWDGLWATWGESMTDDVGPFFAGFCMAFQVTEFPAVVHLSVVRPLFSRLSAGAQGGRRLTTTLATLRADPESMLGLMFSGKHPAGRLVVPF